MSFIDRLRFSFSSQCRFLNICDKLWERRRKPDSRKSLIWQEGCGFVGMMRNSTENVPAVSFTKRPTGATAGFIIISASGVSIQDIFLLTFALSEAALWAIIPPSLFPPPPVARPSPLPAYLSRAAERREKVKLICFVWDILINSDKQRRGSCDHISHAYEAGASRKCHPSAPHTRLDVCPHDASLLRGMILMMAAAPAAAAELRILRIIDR